jgi:pyruvate dehydrogenase E1 component beta subunit
MRKLTIAEALREAIREEMRRDPTVFCIGEDIGIKGGWGAEMAAFISSEAFDYLDASLKRVGAPDTPVPFAPVMENYWVPGEESVIRAVREVIGIRGG